MYKLATLSQLPAFLESLDTPSKLKLQEHGRLLLFKKGEVLAREDERIPHLLYIISGYAAVTCRGQATFLISSNQVFPSSRLAPSKLGLRALGVGTAAILDKETLDLVYAKNPQLLLTVFDQTVQKLHENAQINALRQVHPTEINLLALLWQSSWALPNGTREIPKEYDQHLLAEILGIQREEVSRRRKDLVNSGLLFKDMSSSILSADVPKVLMSAGADYAVV